MDSVGKGVCGENWLQGKQILKNTKDEKKKEQVLCVKTERTVKRLVRRWEDTDRIPKTGTTSALSTEKLTGINLVHVCQQAENVNYCRP